MENSNVLHIPDPSYYPLQLFFFGRSSCMPKHSVASHVRHNYIIHFITGGSGLFSAGQHIYHLHENQGFFISPDTPVFYEASADHPWEYFWIGIDGSGAEDFFSHLGLTAQSPVFECQNIADLSELIDEMLSISPESFENKLKLQGLAFLFLASASSSCSSISSPAPPEANIHIERTIRFIQKHYHQPITVDDIANNVSLNRSYLATLFRRSMGTTIQNYLMDYRISKACELLTLTEDSVHAIAYSCGYNDALTFSKAFKKKKGISPLAYRKKVETLYL